MTSTKKQADLLLKGAYWQNPSGKLIKVVDHGMFAAKQLGLIKFEEKPSDKSDFKIWADDFETYSGAEAAYQFLFQKGWQRVSKIGRDLVVDELGPNPNRAQRRVLELNAIENELDLYIGSSLIYQPPRDRYATKASKRKASAYIRDVGFDSLPMEVQLEILRFIPDGHGKIFIHYGMVVAELEGKVDPFNYKNAQTHLKTDEKTPEMFRQEVDDRKDTKFILLNNDRVIDGHHFIAKAKAGGVTSSLNVLDLTPGRLQKRVAQVQADFFDSYWQDPNGKLRKVGDHGLSAHTFLNEYPEEGDVPGYHKGVSLDSLNNDTVDFLCNWINNSPNNHVEMLFQKGWQRINVTRAVMYVDEDGRPLGKTQKGILEKFCIEKELMLLRGDKILYSPPDKRQAMRDDLRWWLTPAGDWIKVANHRSWAESKNLIKPDDTKGVYEQMADLGYVRMALEYSDNGFDILWLTCRQLKPSQKASVERRAIEEEWRVILESINGGKQQTIYTPPGAERHAQFRVNGEIRRGTKRNSQVSTRYRVSFYIDGLEAKREETSAGSKKSALANVVARIWKKLGSSAQNRLGSISRIIGKLNLEPQKYSVSVREIEERKSQLWENGTKGWLNASGKNSWMNPSGKEFLLESEMGAHATDAVTHLGLSEEEITRDLQNDDVDAWDLWLDSLWKKKWLRVVYEKASTGWRVWVQNPYGITSSQKTALKSFAEDNAAQIYLNEKELYDFKSQERKATILPQAAWLSPSGEILKARSEHAVEAGIILGKFTREEADDTIGGEYLSQAEEANYLGMLIEKGWARLYKDSSQVLWVQFGRSLSKPQKEVLEDSGGAVGVWSPIGEVDKEAILGWLDSRGYRVKSFRVIPLDNMFYKITPEDDDYLAELHSPKKPALKRNSSSYVRPTPHPRLLKNLLNRCAGKRRIARDNTSYWQRGPITPDLLGSAGHGAGGDNGFLYGDRIRFRNGNTYEHGVVEYLPFDQKPYVVTTSDKGALIPSNAHLFKTQQEVSDFLTRQGFNEYSIRKRSRFEPKPPSSTGNPAPTPPVKGYTRHENANIERLDAPAVNTQPYFDFIACLDDSRRRLKPYGFDVYSPTGDSWITGVVYKDGKIYEKDKPEWQVLYGDVLHAADKIVTHAQKFHNEYWVPHALQDRTGVLRMPHLSPQKVHDLKDHSIFVLKDKQNTEITDPISWHTESGYNGHAQTALMHLSNGSPVLAVFEIQSLHSGPTFTGHDEFDNLLHLAEEVKQYADNLGIPVVVSNSITASQTQGYARNRMTMTKTYGREGLAQKAFRQTFGIKGKRVQLATKLDTIGPKLASGHFEGYLYDNSRKKKIALTDRKAIHEKIIAPAIKMRGEVFSERGTNHALLALATYNKLNERQFSLDTLEDDQFDKIMDTVEDFGFVTSTGRFVDRSEAYEIAERAKQTSSATVPYSLDSSDVRMAIKKQFRRFKRTGEWFEEEDDGGSFGSESKSPPSRYHEKYQLSDSVTVRDLPKPFSAFIYSKGETLGYPIDELPSVPGRIVMKSVSPEGMEIEVRWGNSLTEGSVSARFFIENPLDVGQSAVKGLPSENPETSEGDFLGTINNLLEKYQTETDPKRKEEIKKQLIPLSKKLAQKRIASVTFSLEGSHKVAQPKTVLDIGYDIIRLVNQPGWHLMSITPDGDDFDKYLGVLNFYVTDENKTSMTLANVTRCVLKFNEQFKELVRLGPPKQDISAMSGNTVFRVPVVENKTSNFEIIPELTISNANAFALLSFFKENGATEIDPEELSGSIDLKLLKYLLSEKDPELDKHNDSGPKSDMDVLNELVGMGAQVIKGPKFSDRFPIYKQEFDRLIAYAESHDLLNTKVIFG